MKVGDLLLVTGTAFFEKATIKERKKGIYTLDNGIKTDRNLNPLNSKYKIEVFEEKKYKTLLAHRTLSKGIEKLVAINKKGIEKPENLIYVASKLNRILKKLGEK